jgi:tetratricopeptide (TPR) repeat protein
MSPRGPSHLKKSFTANRVFVGRKNELKKFRQALAEPQAKNQFRILNFHGVGGQGKSALCEQMLKQLEEDRIYDKQLGWSHIDFDIPDYQNPAQALLQIRLQLAKQCKIPFPAFDTAFTRYFNFTNKGDNIKDKHPGLFKNPNDLLCDFESIAGSIAGDVVNNVPGLGMFYKYIDKISEATKKWWHSRGNHLLEGLDDMDQHKLTGQLPCYLAADIYDWLFEQNDTDSQKRVVFLFDTHEALWKDHNITTGSIRLEVDHWVRKLAEEIPGTLWVILGRDPLEWGKLDKDWNNDIQDLPLAALSPDQAKTFLLNVPIEEPQVQKKILDSSEGHAFYLELQVDLYEQLKQNGTPSPDDFGDTQSGILPRFTDHLSDAVLNKLQLLAQARFVDESIVEVIAEEFFNHATDININEINRFSFWKHTDGHWLMHDLMRSYQVNHLKKEHPKRFQAAHAALFNHYDQPLQRIKQIIEVNHEQAKPEHLRPEHDQMLQQAAYHQQQIDPAAFPDWYAQYHNIFAEAYHLEPLEALIQQSLSIEQKSLGNEHPNVATSLNNLALLYNNQGRYEKAEPLFQQALSIQQKVLGEEHPDVATSLYNLGSLYHDQGKYDQAETLYQQALVIRQKAFGKEHPAVASSLNNLALLYRNQGRYDQAEPLFQQALIISQKQLGEEHPHVATSMNNLAGLYSNQGKYDQAEPLFQQALIIQQKILGKEHPHVASSMNGLALLYYHQGKYDQAEPLFQQALAILQKALGDEHPYVASSLNNMAGLYSNQGKYDQAEPVFQQALTIRQNVLGKEHPDLATSLNNLAVLYNMQGEYDQAETLFRQALAIRQKILGKEHPDVAASLNDIANNYHDQGIYEQAETLYQQALTIRQNK